MKIQKTFYDIAFFCIIWLALSCVLYFGKEAAENRYIHDSVDQLQSEHESIFSSFARLSELAVEEVIRQPYVLDLLEEAARSGDADRARLREALYRHLLPSYQRLVAKNFKQIHFHFADGTSFLRMHLPGQYGDQLFDVRPAVRIANTEKRSVEGFEIGRHYHAFRYIFPLQQQGMHLGTVEAGVPFYSIIPALERAFHTDYFLMIRKDAITKTLRSDQLENYAEVSWAPDYLAGKKDKDTPVTPHANHLEPSTIALLNQTIHGKVVPDLPVGKPFAVFQSQAGEMYTITFLPMISIGGEQAGYLVSYRKDDILKSLWHGYIVAQLLAAAVVGALFVIHRWNSRATQERLLFQQQIIDSIPMPVCMKDIKGIYRSCNVAFAGMFGLPKKKIIGAVSSDIAGPEQAIMQQNLDQRVLERGSLQQEEMSMVFGDGTRHDMVTYKAPFLDSHGRVTGIIGTAIDITDRKRAEQAIQASHAELAQIFNTAANGMRIVDLDHNIVRANKKFLKMVGLPEDAVLGRKCYEVLPGDACRTVLCPLSQIQGGKKFIEEEETIKRLPNGRRMDCVVTSRPQFDQEGRLIGIIEDFKDVTRFKELEDKLRNTAVTDELTGLYNRRGFMSMAGKQLRSAERSGHDVFLLYADQDNLKEINDSLGHDAGDAALMLVAEILNTSFREADVISRLGGDEFAVLISCQPGSQCEGAIARRLTENIAEANRCRVQPFAISLSFGVAKKEKDEGLDQLMIRADNAMYACKSARKNGRTVS